ncbi:MAG: AraC family transcriptional regulator [Lachnospiraceae bacterium]|jgi:AraC-like DNA-binding protein|nr:AraC family transcriptional regulator [Lachnospiraceae bacterium]MCI1398510.1 AraC family transcriptional regulator [Lachnospiraceae bacterium]MCI1424236.1 AraC family transcriptional regulator [Lachnospiraceae bacterium]
MRVSDLNIDRIYINQTTRASSYHMTENHYHYYYELFYVRQGTCRFFLNNDLYDLHGGDFLIIPPHMVHYNRYLTACLRINVYFKESDLVREGTGFLPDVRERFLCLVMVHIPAAYREMMDGIFDAMLQEEKVDDANTRMMMEMYLKQFLVNCERHCIFHYESTLASRAQAGDEGILSAARFLSEHYATHITLNAMADQAGLSPSYFSKKFRAVTGMGMKEYLSYVRLEHASKELQSTDHSITEVAINCGFSDSNYFKDAFKKMYGISPRAYRAEREKTDQIVQGSILRAKREEAARQRQKKERQKTGESG